MSALTLQSMSKMGPFADFGDRHLQVLTRKRTSSARTVEQIPQRRADLEEHLVRQTAGIGDLYLGRIDIEVGGGALIKQCRRWAPLSSAKRQI